MRRPSFHDDQGSILMALLAIIVIGGLTLITFAQVHQSQRTVLRDRGWTESIQAADAGIQQALSYLVTTEPAVDTITSGDLGLDTAVEGGSFEWVANRSGSVWNVRATGTVADVTRVVEARISRGYAFRMAAFGDTLMRFGGSSEGDSYNSGSGDTLTLNGRVGSNEEIRLLGGGASTFVDEIWEFGDAECTDGCGAGSLHSGPAIDVDGIYDDMVANSEDACPSGPVDGAWEASADGNLVAGTTYCFESMFIDADFEVVGNSTANPAVVYVFTGGVVTKNSVQVDANCRNPSTGDWCDGDGDLEMSDATMPEAGGLLINVLAGNVKFENQSAYVMSITAPRSACEKESGGGQTTFYGSMFCSSIYMRGGFEVHYDDRLSDSGTGNYAIVGYREEVGDTTSF